MHSTMTLGDLSIHTTKQPYFGNLHVHDTVSLVLYPLQDNNHIQCTLYLQVMQTHITDLMRGPLITD